MANACPYQAADGFNDRNRFPSDHLFVGEIENGIRYPLGVYTKAESDALYAPKSVEQTVTDVAAAVNGKADQADLTALAAEVATKASEAEAVAIRARLDALEYTEIAISEFTARPNICELGSTNTIVLTWATTKPPLIRTIDGEYVEGDTARYEHVTSSHLYQLIVADGRTSANAAVNVEFANRIYYGAAADLSSVTTLQNNVLSNQKARTIEVTAGAGEYIIYALPARLGAVDFFVGGFEGGFEEPVTKILTNESGYQETYNVYRSTNAGLGETTVEVKEG